MNRTMHQLLACCILCGIFAGLSLSAYLNRTPWKASWSCDRLPTNRSRACRCSFSRRVNLKLTRSEAETMAGFSLEIFPTAITLAAVRSGYVRADYGRRRTSDPPLILAVGPNRTIRNIEIPMISSGAIFGRVADAEGEPVAGSVVRAWQETFIEGQRALRLITTVSTDDLGDYRLFSLAPGNYYVNAVLRTTDNNTPFFYPNVTDVRAAGRVTLAEGSTAGGINITYRSEARREIRGTISSPIGGHGAIDTPNTCRE